jgi:hypothetical protein
MTNRNRKTLESEILDILGDVDRLADECKQLGVKIKRLRLDVESILNAKEEVINDSNRREDG